MTQKTTKRLALQRLCTSILLLLTMRCGEASKVLDGAGGEDTTIPTGENPSLMGTWDGYLTTSAQPGGTTLTQSRSVALILQADQNFVLNILENGITRKMSGTFTLFPDDQLLFSVGTSEIPTLMPAGSSFLAKIFRAANRATISNDYLTFTLTQTSTTDPSGSSTQSDGTEGAPPYAGLWRCQDEDIRVWKIEINNSGGLIAFAIFNNIERPLWLKGNMGSPNDQVENSYNIKISENNAGLSPLTGYLTLRDPNTADVLLEGKLNSGEAFLSNLRCDLN